MKNIPNLLSAFRIVLIPFFIWEMTLGNTLAAGMILLVSGITDFLDGQLARRFGWITDLGKILDPVADKVTQAAVSITLAFQLRRYWYFFSFFILKDLIMLVLGGYLMKKEVKLEGARWFGKISTFVYYAVMILIVFVPDMSQRVNITLLTVASLCALVSFLLYLPEFRRYRQGIDSDPL